MLFDTLHLVANHNPFRRTGSTNGKWKGGVYRTENGYLKVSAGPNRNKYQHRVVMEELLQAPLCAAYVFPEKGKIPDGVDVEHLDHNRTHNCHCNLMLLSHRIHACLSRASQQYVIDHWEEYVEGLAEKNRVESTPDWVTSSEFDDGEAA